MTSTGWCLPGSRESVCSRLCTCVFIQSHRFHTYTYLWSIYTLSESENVSSVVSDSLWPYGLCPPGSSVHGILRQEYWSRLPCPSPRDLPNRGIEPGSLALQVVSLTTEAPGKFIHCLYQAFPFHKYGWNHFTWILQVLYYFQSWFLFVRYFEVKSTGAQECVCLEFWYPEVVSNFLSSYQCTYWYI